MQPHSAAYSRVLRAFEDVTPGGGAVFEWRRPPNPKMPGNRDDGQNISSSVRVTCRGIDVTFFPKDDDTRLLVSMHSFSTTVWRFTRPSSGWIIYQPWSVLTFNLDLAGFKVKFFLGGGEVGFKIGESKVFYESFFYFFSLRECLTFEINDRRI